MIRCWRSQVVGSASLVLDQILAEAAEQIKGDLCRVEKGSPEGGQFTSCATATKEAPLSADAADRIVAAATDAVPEPPIISPVSSVDIGAPREEAPIGSDQRSMVPLPPERTVNDIHIRRFGTGDTVRVDDDALTFTRPGNGATAAISKADLVALTNGGNNPVLGGTLRLEVDSGSGTANGDEFQWKATLKDDYNTYGQITLTNKTASEAHNDTWNIEVLGVSPVTDTVEQARDAAIERIASRGFTVSVPEEGLSKSDYMPEPMKLDQLYPQATDTEITTTATSGNPVVNGPVKIYMQADVGVRYDPQFNLINFQNGDGITQISPEELRKILAVPSDGIIRISAPNDSRSGFDIYTKGVIGETAFNEYYHLNPGMSIGLINRSTSEGFPTAPGIAERDRLQYADIHDYVSRGGGTLPFSIRTGRSNYTTEYASLIDLNSRDREAGNAPPPAPAPTPRHSSSTYREEEPSETSYVKQIPLPASDILYTGEDVSVSFSGSREPEWLDRAASLAGAPPGSEVVVTQRYGSRYSVKTNGDGIDFEITVTDTDGEKSVYADGIFLDRDTQKGGIGSRAMATMIYNAKDLGFDDFTLTAAGYHGGRMNGYYTWPRLGFDGAVYGSTAEQAVEDLGLDFTPTKISQIFEADGGPEWWRVNGHSFSATFDMREGSKSWQRLSRYMEHRFGNNPFERRRARPERPEVSPGYESVLRPDWLSEAAAVVAGNLCRQDAGTPEGGQFVACDVAPIDVAALNKEANAIVAQQLMKFPEDPRLTPSPTEIVMHPAAIQQFTKGEVKFYGHGTGDDGEGIRPIEFYVDPPLALDRDQLRRMMGVQSGAWVHITNAGDDLYTFRVTNNSPNMALGSFALKPDMQGNYHFWQTGRGVDFSYRPMPMSVLLAIPADGKDSKELQAESEQAMKSASEIVMGNARAEWEAMGGKSAPLWIPENPEMEIEVKAGKQYNYGGHPDDPDAPSYTYFEKPVLDTDTGTLKLNFVGPHSEPNPDKNLDPNDYKAATIYTYPTTKLDIQVDDLVAAIGTTDKITITSQESKIGTTEGVFRTYKVEGDNDIDWKMSYREYVGTDGELHKELSLDGQHYNEEGIDPDNMPSASVGALQSYLEDRGIHLNVEYPYEKHEEEGSDSSYRENFSSLGHTIETQIKSLEGTISMFDDQSVKASELTEEEKQDYRDRLTTYKNYLATKQAALDVGFDSEQEHALGLYFGDKSLEIGLGQQGKETPISYSTIESFESAVHDLPNVEGVFWHGRHYSEERANEYAAKLAVGDEIKFTRTYSSSVDPDAAKNFSRNLVFKVRTSSAKAGGWYSIHTSELEAFLEKGSWFKVLKISKATHGIMNLVEMEEIDAPTGPQDRRHEALKQMQAQVISELAPSRIDEEVEEIIGNLCRAENGQYTACDSGAVLTSDQIRDKFHAARDAAKTAHDPIALQHVMDDMGNVVANTRGTSQELSEPHTPGFEPSPTFSSPTDLSLDIVTQHMIGGFQGIESSPHDIIKDPSLIKPYLTGTVEINKDKLQARGEDADVNNTLKWTVDQDAISFHPAGAYHRLVGSDNTLLSPGLHVGMRSGPEVTIDRDLFTRMVGAADGGRIEITPSEYADHGFGIKVFNPDHEDLGDGREDDGTFSLFYRSPADAQHLNDNDSAVYNGTKPAYASGWIFGSAGGKDIEATIAAGQSGGAETSVDARELVITSAWREWQDQGGVIEYDPNMAEHFPSPEPEEDPDDEYDDTEDETDEDEQESEEEAQFGGPAHAITSDILGDGPLFTGEDVTVNDNTTNLSDSEIALLAGAPPGSTVRVSPSGDNDFALFTTGEHSNDQLVRVRDGSMEWARYFPRSGFQQGSLGAKVFATVVAGARRNGYDTITIHAIGDSSSLNAPPGKRASGYLAWVKMGGDASLDNVEWRRSAYHDKARFDWPGANTIQDIVGKPGGMKWWKEHGGEWFGSFDTSDGSPSMKRLGSYLKHKFGKNPFGPENEGALIESGLRPSSLLDEAFDVIIGDLCRDERGRFASCTGWSEGHSGMELTQRAYDRVPDLQGDPQHIRDFALKHGGDTNEFSALFTPSGEEILSKQGDHDSLHFTKEEISSMEDMVFIHNHPEGSSFSKHDLFLAMKNNVAEMRAVSSVKLPEAYGAGESFQMVILKRPPQGWPSVKKLNDVYEDIEAAVTNEYQDRISRNEVTYAWANFTHRDEINKRIIAALGMPVESYTRIVVGRPKRDVR